MVSLKLRAQLGASALCACLTQGLLAEMRIDHPAITTTSSGERIALTARIESDAARLRVARAYFKTQAGERFFFVPLAAGGASDYRGMLPAPGLGSGSLSYFLLAATTSGDVVKTDTYVVDVQNDSDALARSELKNQQDVDVDLDNYEKAERLLDRLGKQPKANQPVPVASESQVASATSVPGISDYLVVAQQEALLAVAAPLAAATATGATSTANSGAVAGAGGAGTGGGSAGLAGLGFNATTVIVGGALVAGGVVAATSGGGGGGSAGPSGNQIGTTVGPFNPQQTPFSIELIQNAGGTPSPLRLRYRGENIGNWSGVGSQTFPLPDLGGELELILTADVVDGSFDCHFMSMGGTIPGSLFSGSEGDFFLLLPQ